MTTFTATRAAETFPIFKAHGAGLLQVARGTYAIAVNPVAADIYQMCWVPAGAVIVGGRLVAADLDTNGTETLDMDLGWAANGGSGTYDALDADGLGNFGVWVGDAFAGGNTFGIAGNGFDLAGILATGIHPYFTRPTLIQLTAVATAATLTAGSVSVAVHYVVDESLVA
jgi:hypothetical protein